MTPGDAVVVGGGFYGCRLALALRVRGWRVTLLEREERLLARASRWNQARLHNGYHYPRSDLTARRSLANLPRFRAEFPGAVRPITSLYAVAREGSRTSPREFERFAERIGASARPAPPALAELFAPRAVGGVWLADEPVFDADALVDALRKRLDATGVRVRTGVEVLLVEATDGLTVRCSDGSMTADRVVNCTYADAHHLDPALTDSMRWQVAEIALLEVPSALEGLGVTVMDGPFFSTLPFPRPGPPVHSLSHVTYTPHLGWSGPVDGGRGSRAVLARASHRSQVGRMLRDAARFLPLLAEARPVESFFEVKAMRLQSGNDARPILLREDPSRPGLVTVVGGKLDNVYDAEDALLARLGSAA